VRPALGDELDVAVLGVEDGKPDAIALAQPKDDSKLKALAAKLSRGGERYTVQRLGDWSVVADSAEAFDAVRSARAGRSLADVARFKEASAELSGEALANVYVDAAAAGRLSDAASFVRLVGSPRWISARVALEDRAARLSVWAGGLDPAPEAYRPTLLRDVPSGAILAVSFKDVDELLARLEGVPSPKDSLGELKEYLGVDPTTLGAALHGEGVFYVRAGGLVPIFALELRSSRPQEAKRALERIADGLRDKTRGVLPLRVDLRGDVVVLTDASSGVDTSGSSLVDDKPYKDALEAAGVPDEVTVLAYADLQQLVPLARLVLQLVGGSAETLPQGLENLGTAVLFGDTTAGVSRLALRVTAP